VAHTTPVNHTLRHKLLCSHQYGTLFLSLLLLEVTKLEKLPNKEAKSRPIQKPVALSPSRSLIAYSLPPRNYDYYDYYCYNDAQHNQQQEDLFRLPGDFTLPIGVVHVVCGGDGGVDGAVDHRSHRDPRQRWTVPRDW
jgi:hypothetical protein